MIHSHAFLRSCSVVGQQGIIGIRPLARQIGLSPNHRYRTSPSEDGAATQAGTGHTPARGELAQVGVLHDCVYHRGHHSTSSFRYQDASETRVLTLILIITAGTAPVRGMLMNEIVRCRYPSI